MFLRGFGIIMFFSLVLTAGVWAGDQEITLKKSFWSGWQYSVDGVHYANVGVSAGELKQVVNGNPDAVAQLDSYKSNKLASEIIGIPSGLAVGWPLGAVIAGSEWKDAYTIMLGVGIPLGAVSMILDAASTRHLKKAVDLYNDTDSSAARRISIEVCQLGSTKSLGVSLSYSF